MARVVDTPLKKTKGKSIREALNHVYNNVVEAYGDWVLMDPADITTPQKTVDQDIVDQYIENPNREADVAAGRTGNQVLAVKRDGQVALVDGNHRVAAALQTGERVEVLVVDMDQAFADAQKLDDGKTGIGKLLMDAADKKLQENPSPKDVVFRHQIYLERLKAGYVGEFSKYTRQLDKAIKEVLTSLEVETLDKLTKQDLKALLGELREVELKVYSDRMAYFTNELADLAASEADFEHQFLTMMGVEVGAEVTFVALGSDAAYAYALRQPIQATGELLEPFLKGLDSKEMAKIQNEVMKSVAQGRTISQTVQAIRGTKKANYEDGVLGRNWKEARAVVRTATQHVSQCGREATWEANSDIIKKYQIVATLDGRTSQTCKSLDGQVFELGKGPRPPLHPQCRTTTVPYFEPSEWDEGATRSSLYGPVDQKTTYYEWLKDQPEAFQNDALGITRAKLFRDGGLSLEEFSDLQLDRNFQPLTLVQMRELNPRAFEKANI